MFLQINMVILFEQICYCKKCYVYFCRMFRRSKHHLKLVTKLPAQRSLLQRIGQNLINTMAPPTPKEPTELTSYISRVLQGKANIPSVDIYSQNNTFLENVSFDPKTRTWLADIRLTDPQGENAQIRTISARQDTTGDVQMGWFDRGKIVPISSEHHRHGRERE